VKGQRGFTIPELLIAMLLFLALGIATLGALRGFVRVLDGRSTAQNGVLTMEQQIARMRSDAATAFAVFVPEKDVFGRANGNTASGVPGHEVAFYTKTDSQLVETWWVYHYDAATRSLQRYDFDPKTGETGVVDRVDGRTIHPNARYPALAGVKSFSVTSVQANDLTNAQRDPFAPVLAGLMRGQAPVGNPVGFVPSSGKLRSDVYGGNATVEIVLESEHGSRAIHLASGAMASGFTIHEATALRAYVYRKNTHHHAFGLPIYGSRAHVYAQLQYNVRPKDPTSPWRIGCDFEILGAGPGMRYGDRNVNYNPHDRKQTAADIFFRVTHNLYLGHKPLQCDSRIPTPNDTPQPVFVAPPVALDTPPPCFLTANPCWPYNAPPNWSPPSPWPATSPPADWCAGHQASLLCGGNGGGPTATPNPGDTAPPMQFSPPPVPQGTPNPTQLPTAPPLRGPGRGF